MRASSAARPSLWRNFDYAAWWTGNTVSALGTGMSAFGYPLVVLYATGSVARARLDGGPLAAVRPGRPLVPVRQRRGCADPPSARPGQAGAQPAHGAAGHRRWLPFCPPWRRSGR